MGLRVLILSQRLPYAPNRGDRLRVYHMLREVASRAQVDVASFVHDDDEASRSADLRGLAGEVITARLPRVRNAARGAAALFGSTALTHVLLDSPAMVPALSALVRRRRPDVILAFCSSMARLALQPPLSNIPFVLDMIDADSAKWAALATTSRFPLRRIYKREARSLAGFEAAAMRRAFMTLVVNERERAELEAVAPGSRILIMENGVDLASFAPGGAPPESASVVFCGVMNYEPNVRGAVWLARHVWPVVRASRPDARLTLIGSSPSPEVTALADAASGVVVTGTVPDVRPYLWGAAVATAPLDVARGVQNKVLEAVAAGLPCVVTRQVAEGLPREVMSACPIGETAGGFASALIDLLGRTPAERRALAAGADLGALQWSSRLQALMPLLEAAAQNGRSTAEPVAEKTPEAWTQPGAQDLVPERR
jgi:sugar transferase (PEP-CTERM/EpsH1 system associated)